MKTPRTPRVIVLIVLVLIFLFSLLRLGLDVYDRLIREPGNKTAIFVTFPPLSDVIRDTVFTALIYLVIGVALVLHAKGKFRVWICEFLGTGTRFTRVVGVFFIVLSGLATVFAVLIRFYGRPGGFYGF